MKFLCRKSTRYLLVKNKRNTNLNALFYTEILCGRPHQQYSATTFSIVDTHHLLQNKPMHIRESSLVPSCVSSHSFSYSEKISVIIKFNINHVDATKKNDGNNGGDNNGEAGASSCAIDGANAVPIGK